jgi:hypothetical protein
MIRGKTALRSMLIPHIARSMTMAGARCVGLNRWEVLGAAVHLESEPASRDGGTSRSASRLLFGGRPTVSRMPRS